MFRFDFDFAETVRRLDRVRRAALDEHVARAAQADDSQTAATAIQPDPAHEDAHRGAPHGHPRTAGAACSGDATPARVG